MTAVGAGTFLRRPRRGTLPAALALLLAGVAPAAAQSWRTVTVSRQRSGEASLDVAVEYGAGHFRLRPGGNGLLYRMQLRYDEERFEPVAEYDDGSLRLGVDGIGHDLHVGKDRDGGDMELELAPGLPMELALELGAVRADMDLGGLAISELRVKTGASESRLDVPTPNPTAMRRASFEVGAADFTARHLGNLDAQDVEVSAGVGSVTLEFTGRWRRDADVSVDMGLGSLELRFPRGLGVKVEKSTFLTSFDSQGLIKRGDAYYSPDWEDAERRVTVGVDAAFGSVSVVWVR